MPSSSYTKPPIDPLHHQQHQIQHQFYNQSYQFTPQGYGNFGYSNTPGFLFDPTAASQGDMFYSNYYPNQSYAPTSTVSLAPPPPVQQQAPFQLKASIEFANLSTTASSSNSPSSLSSSSTSSISSAVSSNNYYATKSTVSNPTSNLIFAPYSTAPTSDFAPKDEIKLTQEPVRYSNSSQMLKENEVDDEDDDEDDENSSSTSSSDQKNSSSGEASGASNGGSTNGKPPVIYAWMKKVHTNTSSSASGQGGMSGMSLFFKNLYD